VVPAGGGQTKYSKGKEARKLISFLYLYPCVVVQHAFVDAAASSKMGVFVSDYTVSLPRRQ
jgi:hypothetical protein